MATSRAHRNAAAKRASGGVGLPPSRSSSSGKSSGGAGLPSSGKPSRGAGKGSGRGSSVGKPVTLPRQFEKPGAGVVPGTSRNVVSNGVPLRVTSSGTGQISFTQTGPAKPTGGSGKGGKGGGNKGATATPFLTPAQQLALNNWNTKYATDVANLQQSDVSAWSKYSTAKAADIKQNVANVDTENQNAAARGIFQSSIRDGALNDLAATLATNENILATNLGTTLMADQTQREALAGQNTAEQAYFNSLGVQNAQAQTPDVTNPNQSGAGNHGGSGKGAAGNGGTTAPKGPHGGTVNPGGVNKPPKATGTGGTGGNPNRSTGGAGLGPKPPGSSNGSGGVGLMRTPNRPPVAAPGLSGPGVIRAARLRAGGS